MALVTMTWTINVQFLVLVPLVFAEATTVKTTASVASNVVTALAFLHKAVLL